MKRGKRGRGRKSSPKQSLNLPDLDQAGSAVLNSLPSKESQRGCRHAIDEFIAWYVCPSWFLGGIGPTVHCGGEDG